MKIGQRQVRIGQLPQFSILFFKTLVGIRALTHPLKSLLLYLRQSSPEKIEFRDGTVFFLSAHPHDIVTVFVVYFHGDYGKIAHNSVVVDIGANIGVFSIYAAKSGASKVYAFEPNKESFDFLCKNIKANNMEEKVIPLNFAVSNTIGQVKIDKMSGPYARTFCKNSEQGEEYDLVRCITVEEIVKSNKIPRIDMLKMDCEGAEFEIISSFSEDMHKRVSEIRMEYHRNPYTGIIDVLRSQGFHMIRRMGDNSSGVLWFRKP